jgi:hypothetical protein
MSRVKYKVAALIAVAVGFLLMAAAVTRAQADKLSAADRVWIATCRDQLKDENPNQAIVRKYCVCMHGFFEDNAAVDQSDREHMFPPAHLYCNRQAGWKPGPPP